MTDHPIGRLFTTLGTLTARPAAFGLVGLYAVAWLILSPGTLEWHGVATLATWAMTLLIQRAEHRDTQAIQAKLDELLRAGRGTPHALTRLDDEEPEVIEAHRDRARSADGDRSPG
ncbi:MAG: low affinity iron permease family protein [Rhizobiales bacterium]|nr:low affinity iron permease family protein [Hyphomicrobiales bacterium]